MATNNIQGAINELVAVVGAVSGINHAQRSPSGQVQGAYVFTTAYVTDGIAKNQPNNVITDLHNVTIAVLMPLNDLMVCNDVMLALYEPIIDALYSHRNSRTSNHYQTFTQISHTLAPVEWPRGDLMFGYLFTIEGLKIQNET